MLPVRDGNNVPSQQLELGITSEPRAPGAQAGSGLPMLRPPRGLRLKSSRSVCARSSGFRLRTGQRWSGPPTSAPWTHNGCLPCARLRSRPPRYPRPHLAWPKMPSMQRPVLPPWIDRQHLSDSQGP
eukprot:UN4626